MDEDAGPGQAGTSRDKPLVPVESKLLLSLDEAVALSGVPARPFGRGAARGPASGAPRGGAATRFGAPNSKPLSRRCGTMRIRRGTQLEGVEAECGATGAKMVSGFQRRTSPPMTTRPCHSTQA